MKNSFTARQGVKAAIDVDILKEGGVNLSTGVKSG